MNFICVGPARHSSLACPPQPRAKAGHSSLPFFPSPHLSLVTSLTFPVVAPIARPRSLSTIDSTNPSLPAVVCGLSPSARSISRACCFPICPTPFSEGPGAPDGTGPDKARPVRSAALVLKFAGYGAERRSRGEDRATPLSRSAGPMYREEVQLRRSYVP